MQSGAIRFLLSLVLIGGGAVALWWVQFRPQQPGQTHAQVPSLENVSVPTISEEGVKGTLQQVDGQVASIIRQLGDGQFALPQFDVGGAMQTTVSAKFSTTPEQFMKQMREQGAQAALTSVAQSVQVQAGDVSTEIVNEARYQYCKGVVETYESRPR